MIAVRLAEKGRGRALHAIWSTSDAKVLAYCDVDLSTDLAALLPLVAPLISGHSDLAIGTRLGRGSLVVRGSLAAGFSDPQCGFKAIRADAARQLLPLVEDTGWFFDTELLVLAERAGLRIHEVPVDWVDDPDSRVDIFATAVADLKGIARLGRALATGTLPVGQLRDRLGRDALRPPTASASASAVPGVPAGLPGQLVRFAAIGVLSTLAHLVLYLMLRGVLPTFYAQPGCRVVLFTRHDDQVAVLTLWEDEQAADALSSSPLYQNTVREITATGFLVGESDLEVFTIHGGSTHLIGSPP